MRHFRSLHDFPNRFNCSLSGSKFPQVTRTFLNLLADFYDIVVSVDPILLLISNFSRLFSMALGIIPSTPATVGITLILKSRIFLVLFLCPLVRSMYLKIFRFLLMPFYNLPEV